MGNFCKFSSLILRPWLLVFYLLLCLDSLTVLNCSLCSLQDELEPASYDTCLIPTRLPSMSYPSSTSGYSSKGSKKSSKATKSKSGKSKSSKSGKSSKSKQGKRNLHAVQTFEESDVKKLRREQRTNRYQKRNNGSGSRHLRNRM